MKTCILRTKGQRRASYCGRVIYIEKTIEGLGGVRDFTALCQKCLNAYRTELSDRKDIIENQKFNDNRGKPAVDFFVSDRKNERPPKSPYEPRESRNKL